jgi:hypothetical protein
VLDSFFAVRLINGRWYRFGVDTTGIANFLSVRFLYTSPDCSGTPYLEGGVPGAFFFNARRLGETLYLASGEVATITFQSRADVPRSGTSQCEPRTLTKTAIPVTELALSVLGLIPPFEVVH